MTLTPKVFGLGLSKTATSTLTEALNVLRIPTIHYPNDDRTFAELQHGNYRLSILDEYQGVTDTPIAPFYAQFDRAWPGSKFILTIREKNSWLRSAESHWRLLKETGQRVQDERFQAFTDFVSACVYGCTYFNAERFSYAYDMHLLNVKDFFANRPDDLLVVDICSGAAGWTELCTFLDVPVPDGIPFPHAYRTNWLAGQQASADICTVVSDDEPVIIIDHDGLANFLAASRRVVRFGERSGRYWGLPADDSEAIDDLERQRTDGRAGFLAVSMSSLWFLDKFAGFADYLRSRYPCVLTSERLMVFDLR
ncbi:MAG: sulfotransferase family protein [Gemmatimonadaceae bacterium]